MTTVVNQGHPVGNFGSAWRQGQQLCDVRQVQIVKRFSKPAGRQISCEAGEGLACFKQSAGMVTFRTRRAAGWKQQLKSLGVAGIVAYGLLNTVYYGSTFMFIWLYVVKAPRGMGAKAASRKFAEVMSLTWVGSQLTKLGRVAAAVALAPFLDHGSKWLQRKLQLQSQAAALWVVVGCCLATSVVLFGSTVLAWS